MQVEVGKIYEGKVTGITKFGAFVEIMQGVTGMVHISEVSASFVNDIAQHLKVGQQVKVKVLGVNEQGKIGLSIKKACESEVDGEPRAPKKPQQTRPSRPDAEPSWQKKSEPKTFEEMLNRFKQSSEEKIHDLKKSTESKRGSGGSRRSRG